MIHVHALQQGINDTEHPVTGYIYLHGKLEEENGFDLCHIDQLPEEFGYIDDCMYADGIKDGWFDKIIWFPEEPEELIQQNG